MVQVMARGTLTRRVWGVSLTLGLAALALAFLTAGAGGLVIGPGQEEEILALFPPESLGEPVAAGHTLERIAIVRDRIELHFTPADTSEPVWVELRAADSGRAVFARTRHFDVRVPPDMPQSAEVLARWVAASVAARETDSPWIPSSQAVRVAPPPPDFHRVALAEAGHAEIPRIERLYVRFVIPLLWLALAILGVVKLVAGRCALGRAAAGQTAALLLALFLVALALRLWLPPMGPGDIKNTLLAAYDGWPRGHGYFEVGRYGRAPEGLLAWVFLVLPVRDLSVVMVNLLLACSCVPLLYGLARRLGLPRETALVGALLLVVAPLHVRLSPTTSRYIPLIFLTLLGLQLSLAWLNERRVHDLAAAVIALVLASQCRPEALALPAIVLLLVVFRGLTPTTGQGRAWPLAPAGAIYALLLVVPAAPLVSVALAGGPGVSPYVVGSRPVFDPAHNPFLNGAFTPLVWPALAAGGALFGLLAGPRRTTAWLILAALFLAGLLATVRVPEGHILNARYHLTALPFLLLLTAHGLTALLAVAARVRPAPAWASVAVAVAIAALAAGPMPAVTRDTTMNAEYRFLRDNLAKIPDDCVIVHWYPPHDHGLRAQPTLSRSVGRRHRWLSSEGRLDDLPDDRCLVYWRNGACHGPRGDAPAPHPCELLDRAAGDAIAEAVLPAVPVREEHYEGDYLKVGLYRLAPERREREERER